MLSVVNADYHLFWRHIQAVYAECRYSECPYAECHNAECHDAL